MEPLVCSGCKQPVQISWNFCPNCGNILHARPLSTSIGRQLVIYAISFFLPPFGLGYAIKYLQQEDKKTKMIGIISIVLTILSLGLLVITLKGVMDYYTKLLNSFDLGNINIDSTNLLISPPPLPLQ